MKGPKVVIYPDRAGEYRWRLVGGNGEIEASGESHKHVEGAYDAVTTVARNFAQIAGEVTSEHFKLDEKRVEVLESVEEAESRGLEVG